MDFRNFLGIVLSASVGAIVVCTVVIPILSGITIDSSVANHDAIEKMLGLIPLLLVIAIVMFVVAVAIGRTRD